MLKRDLLFLSDTQHFLSKSFCNIQQFSFFRNGTVSTYNKPFFSIFFHCNKHAQEKKCCKIGLNNLSPNFEPFFENIFNLLLMVEQYVLAHHSAKFWVHLYERFKLISLHIALFMDCIAFIMVCYSYTFNNRQGPAVSKIIFVEQVHLPQPTFIYLTRFPN